MRRLATTDPALLHSAIQVLLSPLAAESLDAWRDAAGEVVRRLMQADIAVTALPAAHGPVFRSADLDASVMTTTNAYVLGEDAGEMRIKDPVFARGHAVRRGLGARVWTDAMIISRIPPREWRRSTFFHEILVPAGVHESVRLHVPLAVGEADLIVSYNARTPRDIEQPPEVLQFLLPAFAAGVQMALRLAAQASALMQVIDALREPLMVVGMDGLEIHRNSVLQRILKDDPQSDRITSAAHMLARELVAWRAGGAGVPLGHRVIRTIAAEYRLRGTYAPPGMFASGEATVVSVEQITAPMPNPETLAGRFGLSTREAEVALMLACGHSDAVIGQHLGISRHTVRHHGTHIFRKMGIRSRTELSVRVLRTHSSFSWSGTSGETNFADDDA